MAQELLLRRSLGPEQNFIVIDSSDLKLSAHIKFSELIANMQSFFKNVERKKCYAIFGITNLGDDLQEIC